MTPAVTATAMLLRIRNNVAAGEPVARDDARYLMMAIDEWLSGTEFAVAFGVKPAPGEADPRKTIAENRRDELIRLAAQDFLGHVPAGRRAEELNRAWTRYFQSAWHAVDCKQTDCPARYAGKLETLLFEITRLRPHVLSERQLRRILAIRPPRLVANELWSSEADRSARPGSGAASAQRSEAIHVPANEPRKLDRRIFVRGEGNVHGT
jgi:hypothetical protein